MQKKLSFLINLCLALLVGGYIALFSGHDFLNRFELAGLDILFRFRGEQNFNKDISIIEIQDDDIIKVGRWPWPRTWHAALIRALSDMGVDKIYFDILFSEASSDPDEDVFLAQAMREASNVYLPYAFINSPGGVGRLEPIPIFKEQIPGTGFINVDPDVDGAIRRISLYQNKGAGKERHVAFTLAMDKINGSPYLMNEDQTRVLSDTGDIFIPTDYGRMLVNWRGKWRTTFNHFSFLDILSAYDDMRKGHKPKVDVSALKNSICFVGLTATGLYDIKPVPMEPAYPSVGVLANAVDNIINKKFIRTVPLWVKYFLIMLFAFAPLLLIIEEHPVREILSGLFIVLFFIVTFAAFKKDLWIPYALPMMSLIVSYVVVAGYNLARVTAERSIFKHMAMTDSLTGLYNIRYFKRLLDVECIAAVGDAHKRFCIVMGDLDHFKKINDTYGHQAGDYVLKSISDVIVNSVRGSDVVARYGGEEIIALLRTSYLDDARNVVENIRKKIEALELEYDGRKIKITMSFGISKFNKNDDALTVVKRADNALYRSKESGRNMCSTVDSYMEGD